jgi:hypothetical protein
MVNIIKEHTIARRYWMETTNAAIQGMVVHTYADQMMVASNAVAGIHMLK